MDGAIPCGRLAANICVSHRRDNQRERNSASRWHGYLERTANKRHVASQRYLLWNFARKYWSSVARCSRLQAYPRRRWRRKRNVEQATVAKRIIRRYKPWLRY